MPVKDSLVEGFYYLRKEEKAQLNTGRYDESLYKLSRLFAFPEQLECKGSSTAFELITEGR